MPRDAAALALFLVVALLLLAAAPYLVPYGLAGAIALEVAVVGVPCLVYAATRGDVRAEIGLVRPRARHLAGAALIGSSLWYVLLWAVMPLQERIAPTPPELEKMLEPLIAPQEPLWAPLLAAALVPAVFEEILCRGILVRALATRGTVVAIVASAALFGLLHASPFRFLPTFLLGLSLGVVCLASGSVIPAMLLHFLHNAAVVTVPRLPPAITEAPPWPLGILAIGLCALGHVIVGRPPRGVIR